MNQQKETTSVLPEKRVRRKKKKVLRRSSLMDERPPPESPTTTKTTHDKQLSFQSLAIEQDATSLVDKCKLWCDKDTLNNISNHTVFTLLDAFLSFWVLLVPPFKDLFISVDADEFLVVCTVIIFVFFVLEIILLSIGQDKFFGSTYFWLDVVATASLIVDMLPRDYSGYQRQLNDSQDTNDSIVSDRYVQILGRLGRTVRLLRLFRQLRVIKVLMRGFNDDEKNEKAPESGAAEKLVELVSDRMSRRVVVIILVSVISIMLLQYPELDQSRAESVRILAAVGRNGTTTPAFKDALTKFLELRANTASGRLLSLSVNNETFKSWAPPPDVQQNELRTNQWEQLILTTDMKATTIASFDLRQIVAAQAEYDIGIIAAVTGILFFFAVLLSWDSVQLIREPFQKMLRAEHLSKALLSFFKVTAHSDDINDVSKTVVEASHQLLRCRSVHLYFIDSVSQEMTCRHSCVSKIVKPRTRSWTPDIRDIRASFGGRSSSASNMTRKVTKNELKESFSIKLTDQQYLSVLVANNGKSVSKSNVLCFNGNDYTCKNVLVIPVLDNSKKVVAVVEAVDKRHGEFTEDDRESMEAFSEQMSAVISRKALDAIYSNLLADDSNTDEIARSFFSQYSNTLASDTRNINDEESPSSHKKNNSMGDELRAAKSPDNESTRAQILQRTEMLTDVDSNIGKYFDWNTNLFEISIVELQYAVVAMMSSMGLLIEFRIPRNTMINFLEVVANSYNADIPYHNFHHGFNVFQVCTLMLQDTNLEDYLERCDMLALLLGAICHDVGHKGVNNQFHKAMYRKDPLISKLALTYNDVSVLENMHCSKAFDITAQEGCNIFEKFTKKKEFEVRRMMIKGILATDMEHHMLHVKKLQSTTNFEIEKIADRIFLVEVCMHTSDLNNPTQPWENSKRWAHAVAQEFVNQVKLEKEYGLPVSSHMDLQGELNENDAQWAGLNIFFSERLVKGLVEAFCDFFPSWRPRMDEMENNLIQWKKIANSKPPVVEKKEIEFNTSRKGTKSDET